MIWKSGFSEKIMLKQMARAGYFSQKSHPALACRPCHTLDAERRYPEASLFLPNCSVYAQWNLL
jgi:hypothetical protein